jgi:hypothetical protein
MARVDAFIAAGGFDAGVPAGEEAELSQRLRARQLRVEHLDVPMGTHDMGPVGPSAWWLRNVRTGQAYAQAAAAGRHRRETGSALFWGLALPLATLGLAWPTHGLGLALALAYPLQAARVARGVRARGWSRREAWWYGSFTVLAKVPEAVGTLRHLGDRLRGRAPALLHYR